MRLSTTVSLIASGVLGVGALFVAKVWLPNAEGGKAQVQAQADPMITVVAAKTAIAVGAKVDASKLVLVTMPAAAAPQGAYTSIDQVIRTGGAPPVALAPLARREAVLPGRLSGVGAKPSVATMIAPGQRAYTIGVSSVAGGGGHVLPGDRVDVLLARETSEAFVPEGSKGKQVRSDVVIQNVRVLAINLNADFASTEKMEPDTATLEVSLPEAEQLALASEAGELSLALRRIGAAEETPVRTITIRDVSMRGVPTSPQSRPAAARRAAPGKEAPRSRLVIVNGDQATTVSGT